MSNFQAFMAQNAETVENIKRVISNRFKENGKPVPFELRAITNEEDSELRKSCQKRVKVKKGQTTLEIDQDKYLGKLVAACVVYPDLKNIELQKSYGVLGDDTLIKKMLTPGEFTDLLVAVQEINGYDKDMNDLVEEAKN